MLPSANWDPSTLVGEGQEWEETSPLPVRALPAGFRLRVEEAAHALAARVGRAADSGLTELPVAVEGPEGAPLPLLTVATKAPREWAHAASRAARGFPGALAVTRRFPARGVGKHGIEAAHEDVWIPLRWDQILTVRAWGIGFEGDPLLIDAIERRVFRWYADALAAYLRGAGRVLAYREYEAKRMPRLVADPLERLMLDLLNEPRHTAHAAGVEEDFLEKTDLRLRFPELGRKRGARLQVSWSVDEAAFERKAASLRLREEFVFVTPFTLARDLAELDPAPTPKDVIANLSFALRHADTHPLGPIAFVPEPWREAIREAVRRDALATTEKLRERERTRRPAPKS